MKSLREYLQLLVPLVLTFAVYHWVAVPLLEPREEEQKSRWETPARLQRAAWWDEFFVEDSWQRKNPKFLQTQQGILLFEKREEISPTRWHIFPLTILIPQKGTGTAKRAIFIENPRGAEIQFKSVPDWTAGQPPPIVSGQLIGDIRIWAPPDDLSKGNGLLIDTKDVRIDRRKIWTDKTVEIQMGNSRVRGRDMSIYMDQDLLVTEPTTQDNSPFNGLDYLNLIYVDQVYLGLNKGGLWPSEEIPDARSRDAYATLTCNGGFHFQFHQSQAIFKNTVHMEHVVQGLEKDTFDCDELKLQVGWEGKRHIPPQSSTDSPTPATSTASNWNIERLEATGLHGVDARDQSKWLKLHAPGMRAAAHGQHLVMDFLSGKVNLSNRIPGTASRDTTPVHLQRDAMQLWSPEVEYQSPEAVAIGASPSTDKPRRLGTVLAEGTGMAQLENKNEPWKLSWGKRLLVFPDGENDQIVIDGRADASSPTQGRFIAEKLRVWMTPMTESIADKLRPYYADGKVPQSLPRYLRAEGEVIVNSPQLRAQVQAMQVWFSYPMLETGAARSDSQIPLLVSNPIANTPAPSIDRGLVLQPASPPLTSPVVRTPLSPPTIATPNRSWAAKPSTPMNVTSQSLIAKVMSVGEQTRVEDLQLEGNFTMTQEQLSDESPWPFTATGQTLRVEQTAPDVSNITMTGQPAKLQVGHGWVVAPELHLFQSEQQFWIDHPGEMMLPIEALEKTNDQPSLGGAPSLIRSPLSSAGMNGQGDGFHWEEAPRLSWGKRMTFDGKTARFNGNISVNCRIRTDVDTLWHIKASATQLALEMERPVPLRAGPSIFGPNDDRNRAEEKKAQVSIIRFEDKVDIIAVQTDRQGNRRSVEDLKVAHLDVLVPTQEWIGQGPGELLSRRLGNANPMSTERTAPSSDQAGYQCVHLSFLGRMQGWMPKRLVSFYDRVDAVMGPIAGWSDALNVHEVNRLGPNQSRLICDQLNIFDASQLSWNQAVLSKPGSPRATALELDALGRVRMDTMTDSGEVWLEGNSMKYNALNDIARIEGLPREPAKITKLPLNAPIGTEPDKLTVSYAAIGLKSGTLDAQINKLDMAMPANLQGPHGPKPVSAPAPNNPPSTVPTARDFNPFQPPPAKKR